MIALMRLMSVMIKILSKFKFNYMNHNVKFKLASMVFIIIYIQAGLYI